jgi:uncharacterized protein DUF1841
MFDPSREQVRQTFFDAWRRYRAGELLTGMDAAALDVMQLHPEYREVLENPEKFRDKDYSDEGNPFLHMSLHLALEEQLSIDQPPGVALIFKKIVEQKQGDRHAALHEAIECLAHTLWRAQRDGAPPDAAAYLECLTRISRR